MNEQFRRKIHQDVYGSRKLFWKEVKRKVESCSIIKNGNGRLGEYEVQRIWKDYFQDL